MIIKMRVLTFQSMNIYYVALEESDVVMFATNLSVYEDANGPVLVHTIYIYAYSIFNPRDFNFDTSRCVLCV